MTKPIPDNAPIFLPGIEVSTKYSVMVEVCPSPPRGVGVAFHCWSGLLIYGIIAVGGSPFTDVLDNGYDLDASYQPLNPGL